MLHDYFFVVIHDKIDKSLQLVLYISVSTDVHNLGSTCICILLSLSLRAKYLHSLNKLLMKLIIFIVALLVTTPIFVFSQAANDEQTLKQIEQELLNALLKNDAPVFERYVADAFIFTGPDGGVMNKTENIAALKSGDLKFESSKVDDMKVQLHGNTGIVTYQATDKGTYKGKDISGKNRWTDVFVKKGGDWQIVATQGTPLAMQK